MGLLQGYRYSFSDVNRKRSSLTAEWWNGDWAYRMVLTPDSQCLVLGGYCGSLKIWSVSASLYPRGSHAHYGDQAN
jgi:hypothetical protein